MHEGSDKKGGSRSVKVALLSALLGAGCLHLYLQSYEDEVRGGELVDVLSITRDVPAGTVLDGDLLDVRHIPERYLDERHVALADLARVEGIRVQVALAAGDALRWTDLGISERATQLSKLVSVGQRAIRIGGSHVSFGGLLRPGDRVDVLITEPSGLGDSRPPRTWTLLENVMVLAVGDVVSGTSAEGEGQTLAGFDFRAGSDAVTLEVRPEEAERFESHRKRGSMSLTLRNPEDLTVAAAKEARRGH